MAVDRVLKYAKSVLSGKEVAGQYVKLACERHLDDLEKSKTKEFPYKFNKKYAEDAIDFFETLTFTDGKELKGKQVQLMSFQAFIVGSLYGWVQKESGHRRFNKSYIQLARKNAKSLLNGGIGLKMGGFDGYDNAQVYCVATKMKQARIVWNQASKFIAADNDLKELFKVKEHDAIIKHKESGSEIIALGRDKDTIDGFDPHCGIIDEYHAHKTNQMVKLLEDGSVNQDESLISIITTAGFNLNSPCYEEYEYCTKLLKGGLQYESAEKYFVFIAQMDEIDDIWDPKNWIKANPLVATLPQGIAKLKQLAEEAREKGGETLNNFLTKSLNIWVQFVDNGYIETLDWKDCATELTLSDFKGKKCFIGLDLSSGGDLTSLAIIVPYTEADSKKYFIHSHSFMPSRRLMEHEKTDNAPYRVWVKDNILTITETLGGIKTDYKYILSYLEGIIRKYDLKVEGIGYDPHNADAFLADLEKLGDCIEIYQTPRGLHDSTEDFRLEVRAKNITYNKNNKLLTWSVINAVTVSNNYGEIKIDKTLRHKRIDPVDAVIDAYKLAFKQEEEVEDIFYVPDLK